MSKKIRDYLFIVFIILFILGTIFISLYASGFQINLSWPLTFNHLLIKTGTIAIKTNPEGATIYLNNQPQANFSLNPWKKEYLTTATKIRNVLPGKYNLNLKLKGYWSLTKKITVYSGQTTFVENINLFKSDLPQLISLAPKSKLELSSNYDYLYLSNNPEVIDLKTKETKKISQPVNSIGTWLKNNNQLLINGDLFDYTGNNKTNYKKILGLDANNFYYDENQNRLYYQNGSSLNYFSINKQTSTLLVKGENYLTYEIRNNNLFLVAIKNGQTVLQLYSLKNQEVKQEIKLPTVGHYVFIPGNRPLLTLYDNQNKTLYLINPANIANDIKTVSNVVSWQWLNDKTLFYNNSWEIYLLNIPKNRRTLLIRVGEKIAKIIWNKKNNYLIFSTTNSLNAYDPKIGLITKIFMANEVFSPILDNTNDTLYFWAKIGKQRGIYSLLLQ